MHSPLFRASAPSLPTQRRKRLHQALAAVLLIGGAAASPATAATIVITSPDDTNPNATGTCTLRQAIVSMNTGALAGNCAVSDGEDFGIHDTITFAASALATATTPGTITLADSADTSGTVGGTLLITGGRLTIDGKAWRGTSPGRYPDGVTIARPANATKRFGVIRDTASTGGALVLKGLAIRNGYSFGGGGGVAVDAADLTMSDCRVSGNRANDGGGIWSPGGTLTLTRCTIDDNIGNRGGGVYAGSGTATITASTISGNGEWGGSWGGGIRSKGTLAVIDSTISGNSCMEGCGIYVDAGATLTLTRSLVAGNAAYTSGSGIDIRPGGTATVTASTIAGNAARYNGAGVYSQGALTVTNSTIAGNHCYRGGGGVALSGDGTLHLEQATLAQNIAATGGGIGYARPPFANWTGSATIDHSIVSGNTQSSGNDVDLGSAWSGSGNLIASPNAALGPLQDNGGPTPTMQPDPGSAALDAIAPQDCMQPIDQRGVARPWGAGCDIGAVEVVPDRIFFDGFDAASVARTADAPSRRDRG